MDDETLSTVLIMEFRWQRSHCDAVDRKCWVRIQFQQLRDQSDLFLYHPFCFSFGAIQDTSEIKWGHKQDFCTSSQGLPRYIYSGISLTEKIFLFCSLSLFRGKQLIPQSHVYCLGTPSPRPLQATSVRCCRRNAYDQNKNSCCRGSIIPLGYPCGCRGNKKYDLVFCFQEPNCQLKK